eukprot:4358674-Prymnesium_polylepis.1
MGAADVCAVCVLQVDGTWHADPDGARVGDAQPSVCTTMENACTTDDDVEIHVVELGQVHGIPAVTLREWCKDPEKALRADWKVTRRKTTGSKSA